MIRIAIVDKEKCKPSKCQQECIKKCPVQRTGKEVIKLIDIETYHSKSKPMVRVNGCNDFSFHISLSHEENFALAVVLSFET